MDHLICEPPSGDIAILLNLALVDRLQAMIRAEPGREIGGILWGHRDSQSGISGRRIITIDDFEPVESEHLHGPAYGFSERDRAAISSALSGAHGSAGSIPVGFFRSHQRKGLYLDEADFSMFREYFSGSSDVFLLARPEPPAAPVAGFFLWQDGKLRRRSSCAEFPLDRSSIEAGEYPLLKGSFGPAEFPAFIPQSHATGLRPALESRRAKRMVYGTIGAALIVGTLIWAAFLHYAGRGEDSSTVSLTVERKGNSLRLLWDPNAPAVEHANSGILWISDGDKRRGLELNAARLKAGSFAYTPESGVVNFRLDLLKVLAQGSESVRWVADRGAATPPPAPGEKPSPSAPNVAAALRAPPTEPGATEPPASRPPPQVRLEPVVSISTQPYPSSRVRDWMSKVPLMRKLQRNRYHGDGFVPPKTVREVLPHVPARLAHDLPGESRVDLKLSVDANGTVREIDLVSGGGDERLAKIAAEALRQWRFEPARFRDRAVPCDLLATLNFRNPAAGLVAQRE
jgi:protein TonB